MVSLPNINDILAYYTVKYAMIRDWRLGALQKTLMLLILAKIIFHGMVMNGIHLLSVPVYGSARGQATQPTKDLCDPLNPLCLSDFTPLSKLIYCSQYEGKGSTAKGRRMVAKAEDSASTKKETATTEAPPQKDNIHDIPKKNMGKSPLGSPQAECEYLDAPAMTQGRSPVPGTIFLPTRIVEHSQIRGCKPSAANHFACDTKPWVHKPGVEPTMKFIAEVERFQLLINQAFHSDLPGQDLSGRAADFNAFIHGKTQLQNMKMKHQGFVQDIDEKIKNVVKNWAIPDGNPNASTPFRTAYSTEEGDVMGVADLMRLADARGSAILDQPRLDGTSMRSQGAVISMNIRYTNEKKFDPLGNADPQYTITASYLPMRYYKITYQQALPDDERLMMNVHSILILMRVFGSIRVFSFSYMLTILTTAIVTLTMANTLTDYIMMYCFEMSDKYTLIKYQATMDFSAERKSLSAVKKKYGKQYSALTNKAMAHSDILNNAAESVLKNSKTMEEACPTKEEILGILLKFEHRLNRLDGSDAVNALSHPSSPPEEKDPGARCLNAWEQKYERVTFGVTDFAAE